MERRRAHHCRIARCNGGASAAAAPARGLEERAQTHPTITFLWCLADLTKVCLRRPRAPERADRHPERLQELRDGGGAARQPKRRRIHGKSSGAQLCLATAAPLAPSTPIQLLPSGKFIPSACVERLMLVLATLLLRDAAICGGRRLT